MKDLSVAIIIVFLAELMNIVDHLAIQFQVQIFKVNCEIQKTHFPFDRTFEFRLFFLMLYVNFIPI